MIRSRRARNSAAASDNKIHDDTVARDYGFEGGLVPGRDVYAYMAHLPVAYWGEAWLERGTISAVLRRPVYHGDLVEMTSVDQPTEQVIELRNGTGTVRATATAALPEASSPPADDIPPSSVTTRQPASPESLAVGTILMPRVERFLAVDGARYLREIDEDLPLYRQRGLAHPGWMLRQANLVFMNHVILGPWIHSSSQVSNFAVVSDGDQVVTKARVIDLFERAGHRFVVLDVMMTVSQAVVMRVEHTAIYEPRRPEAY